MSADWDTDWEVPSQGHSMPFMRALKEAAEGLILRSAVPRWLLPLSQRGRRAVTGFMEMEVSSHCIAAHRFILNSSTQEIYVGDT